MVGVTGSIPVAPTIKRLEKSAVSATFSEDDRASQCLNKPRTVPKSRTGLGKRWAECSRKVRRCNQQKFGQVVRERRLLLNSPNGAIRASVGLRRRTDVGGGPSRLHDVAEAFAVAASVNSNCAFVRPGVMIWSAVRVLPGPPCIACGRLFSMT